MPEPQNPHTASTPLPGSDRRPRPGARPVGAVDPASRVEATIVLRRRAPLEMPATAAPPLTRDELAARFGASPEDVERVRAWAGAAGLGVESVDAGSRRIRVSGSAAAVAAAFGTDLEQAEIGGVRFRQRTGELHVPADVADIVVAVLGVDDRPQARSRAVVVPRAQVRTSYTPPQLATIYRMPPGDGAGQRIAIVELGGGYGESDLTTYFDGIGVPAPTVTAIGVDGAENAPGADPSGADGEVLLDIEVAGGIAPGATIAVYFAPNTDAGFLDAVSEAAHADPTPTALSISWGQSEDDWTAQARAAMDDAFADAAALGVTVTVAAGDDGSSDRATDGRTHVDFPASSPHVLACGGTTLQADPVTGAVSSETVWGGTAGDGATGGGVSVAFAIPSWQEAVGVPARVAREPSTTRGHADPPDLTGPSGPSDPSALAAGGGRGVPDVAATADPRTGYDVLVDGTRTVIGGTSAVAPLWAGLVCRLAQQLGRPLGLLAPALYERAQRGVAAPGFRDIVTGSNGAYSATAGWDACTGLGVPDGAELLTVLGAAPS